MSYDALYTLCQEFAIPVSRAKITAAATELAQLPSRPKPFKTNGMLPTGLRGQFIRPGDTEHPLAKYCKGAPLILLARDLNYCWERFVFVKELMHVFDTAWEAVSTGPEFEQLILAFGTPPPGDLTDALQSEIMAFWMALGCMCPEQRRLELQRQRESGALTDLDIATELRIPEQYVNRLFVPNFKTIIHTLRQGGKP